MSLAEMMVIAVVALIAIGPKELPVVLRTVGRWLAAMRDLWAELRGVLDDVMQTPTGVDAMGEDRHARYIRDAEGNYHRIYDMSEVRKAGGTTVASSEAPPAEPPHE